MLASKLFHQLDLATIFQSSLLAGLSFLSGLVLYRLKFHPLANYPGPFFAKITRWYDTYHCFKKDKALDLLRCQQKYGPIFRYGPNFIVVNTANGFHDIYAPANGNNIRKGPQYKFLHHNGFVSTLSAIDKSVHSAKRRILSSCFTTSALRHLEHLMIGTIDDWTEALGSGAAPNDGGWSSPKDMADWSNYLTFDILGELCFGKSFGLIKSDEFRAAPNLMLARTRLLAVIAASPFYPMFKFLAACLPLDRLLNSEAVRDVVRFQKFALAAMKERQRGICDSEKAPRRDFVHFLTHALQKGYTEADFMQEIHLLMVAGSDTVAITIAACFYYLSRNSYILHRLQNEIQQNFDTVDDIQSGATLSSCRYLRAVIDETMRIAPPAGVPLPREIIGDGAIIDGLHLPAGMIVGTALYALHNSPEYFTDPEIFRPERWMAEHTSAEERLKASTAFAPFSIGTRACIGKKMAYNELSIALARVLYLYDMRLQPGDTTGQREDGLYDLKDVFIAERWGPKIQFRRHLGPEDRMSEGDFDA